MRLREELLRPARLLQPRNSGHSARRSVSEHSSRRVNLDRQQPLQTERKDRAAIREDEQERSARVAKQSPFDRADQSADKRRQSESASTPPQLESAETGFQPVGDESRRFREVGDSPATAGRPQLERALRTTSLPQAGAGICRAAIEERAARAAAFAAAPSASDRSNELSSRHSDDAYFDSSAIPGFDFPVAQWGCIERHSTRPRTTPPTRMFSTVSIWTGMFVCVICVLSIGAPLRDRPAIKDLATSRSRPMKARTSPFNYVSSEPDTLLRRFPLRTPEQPEPSS